jgi:hypothetical protein
MRTEELIEISVEEQPPHGLECNCSGCASTFVINITAEVMRAAAQTGQTTWSEVFEDFKR